MALVGNTEEGNTKPPRKRCTPSKRWCFTLNNYSDQEMETLELSFKSAKCEYVIGREVGEEGTPHLQGYIESPVKIRPVEKFKTERVHWEKCKGTREENVVYCTKEGNYTTTLKVRREPTILKEEQLYPWQKDLLKILDEDPDDRTVHWYWEPLGRAGKTSFCKYLSATRGAIPLEGKKNDILYCAAEFESDIYVWDLERTMEGYISYGALEKIKNGYYMCSKYESKPIIRANPHVIVMANFPPRELAMSLDRWNIVRIDEEVTNPEESEAQ